MGRPTTGRKMIVGQGVWLKVSLPTPTPVAMMTARKQMMESPTADATMKARMRSSRWEEMGASLGTCQGYGRARVL